jgi:enoyl-CoA hydratase/carnithine racemase
MADTYPDIRYEVSAGVARITLDRPARLNAWTGDMERSVRRAIGAAAADDAARAIVITGAGRGFCAGADMQGLQVFSGAAASASAVSAAVSSSAHALGAGTDTEVSAHYPGRFGYLLAVQKPIIAAINGPCAGIGLVLALFCDLRFARSDAKLTTAFAQRGLIAEHGSAWILPRLVGPSRALDLLCSARVFSGDEAARIGLVTQAFAADSFERELEAYVSQLSQRVSPRSLGVIKTQIWKALFQDFDASMQLAEREMRASFTSADFQEGVAHFVEKRAPRFSGK